MTSLKNSSPTQAQLLRSDQKIRKLTDFLASKATADFELLKKTCKIRQPASLPSFLEEVQSKALSRFKQLGLPSTRIENWKYSPLTKFWRDEFWLPDANAASSDNQQAAQILDCSPKNTLQLTLQNGQFTDNAQKALSEIEGIRLVKASDITSDILQKSLITSLEAALQGDGLTAATLALQPNPWVLEITDRFNSEQVLHLQHILPVDNAAFNHTFVYIAPHSKAQIIETIATQAMASSSASTDKTRFYTSCVSIVIGQNAKIEHLQSISMPPLYAVQQENHIYLEKNAHYHSTSFSILGDFIRSVSHVHLNGVGAFANCVGLLCPTEKQHHDTRVFFNHHAKSCVSRSLVKAIAKNQAKAIFNGRIYIAQDSTQSDGALESRNILLDNSAEINTKPELEIYCDDVQCRHGATISQLDLEQLLYCRSRGLTAERARSLLLESFVMEVYLQLPQLLQQDYLQKQLTILLESLSQ